MLARAMVDRLKASIYALIRAAVPRLDYYTLYDGKVVKWNKAAQTVDVSFSDSRMPSMSGVPFMRGPGETFDVLPGTHVMVGSKDGDPAKDFACLWSGGEHVRQRVLNADDLILGGEFGAEPPPLGTTYRTAEDALFKANAAAIAALAAGLQALGYSGAGVAASAMAEAQVAFDAGKLSYLAKNVKVK